MNSTNRNRRASRTLKLNVDNIMKAWEDTVRKEIPAARNIESSNLRNSLPSFIKSIASFISTTVDSKDGTRSSRQSIEDARSHGIQRAEDLTYTLDQVIIEYRILRRTILQVLEQRTKLTAKERENLLEAIDNGLVLAATEFASRRGFQAARLRNAESETTEITRKLNVSRRRVDELEIERTLRERFVSTLTHDLRTPLTAVKACADLIIKQAENTDTVRKLAVKISDGADRINKMIRDLLDANQIEEGKPVALKIHPCNLEALTRDVLDNFAAIYGDRFSLEVNGDQNGFLSPDDLRRVIENLVVNGLKYGHPLGKISIDLYGTTKDLSIEVHNEGEPIPPDQQAILFQPYKRLLSAQMGGKSGWGLGLTLVRGIIEAHGGTIKVDSDFSQGTTFTVQIPRDSRLFYKAA